MNQAGSRQNGPSNFVMGMVRRDFGAAGLYQLALTPYQTIVALVIDHVVYTLHRIFNGHAE